MDFQKQKEIQLAKKDKSKKGSIDEKIIKLCEKINSKPQYFTTSSCAGRIILIKDSKEKKENLILFSSHEKISFDELKRELEKAKEYKNVNFKQEPCILHVVCKTIKDAEELVKKAIFAGWKKSGIKATKKRIICELLSTENIEMPIIRGGKILVEDSFIKLLCKEANEKLKRTWKKIEKLEKLL